jgi:predicted transposase/invertase (TIGR01784 family)
MLKASRFLNPKADIVFKKVFGQHEHLLRSFLNAMIPLPDGVEIDHLEYLPSDQVPEIPEFKHTIVDVKCYDQLGRHFIVEMQMEWTKDFASRILYGASQAYTHQLKRGASYADLAPVYALWGY